VLWLLLTSCVVVVVLCRLRVVVGVLAVVAAAQQGDFESVTL
jgi:hypothetical protein